MKDGDISEVVKIRGYSDGYVQVLGHILFFKTWGEEGKKGTVLCLHGGPGGSCDAGSNMAKLTEYGYKVVMYDQLGGGKSEKPQDKSLYNVDKFVEEVEGVRRALNLGKIHLFGGSWGGMLNVAYAVKYSKNLHSLVISSGASSTKVVIDEMEKMRQALPKKIRDTLSKYEKVGEYKNPEYLKALKLVYKKHFYRKEPWPPELVLLIKSGSSFSTTPRLVYNLMWGENEITPTGNLRYWDVTDKLGNIDVPTLIICGEYDYVSPRSSELLHQKIKGSKLVILKNCGHALSRQEPEKYLGAIQKFLDSVAS